MPTDEMGRRRREHPSPQSKGGDASMTETCDDAEVMRIWRECGLPEYFLGNGGTNYRLVAFAKACAKQAPPSSAGWQPMASAPAAWSDVLAERRRQIESEGWTPEHDDAHENGALARAAACYAIGQTLDRKGSKARSIPDWSLWPWDAKWWKPRSHRENLVRSGALILAEIERLDRAPSQEGASEGEGETDDNSSPAVAAPFDPDEYRVLATGSRHARHDGPIVRVMNGYFEKHGKHLTVAAGGMRGVDTLVEQWCEDRGVPFKRYPVDHAIDGPWPAAGPRRNKRMHDDFRPHEVVAFPGGSGTASMMAIARRAETPVNEVRYV